MRLSLLLVLLLSSCIITPKVKKVYDPICDKFKKKVSLQSTFIVQRCPNNHDCTGIIGISIITGAISGAISVAILSVGNIYYAVEHQNQCRAKLNKKQVRYSNESKT